MVYAMIVVYNKECEDSETLKSIQQWKDKIKLVVFDNSTIQTNNKEYCENKGIQYFTVGENVGLSKGYNYVIQKLSLNDEDFVIVLDDDTELTEQYIEEVLQSVDLNKDILLPIVYSGDMILSPTNIKYKCGSVVVKDIKELNLNSLSAINSGMVVSANVYKKLCYNEELFLDCVDHEFMKQIRENKFSVSVMKSEIQQNYSRGEKPRIESALFRFGLFKKDFKTYCQLCDAELYYKVSIIKFVLSYTLKYRSFKFIKLMMTNK